MSDNPLDKLPAYNRVSIRAVLVREGEDPSAALAEAGIVNPVAIPVVLGEQVDLPGGILGDGITPNLKAVLETEHEHDFGPSSDSQHDAARPTAVQARPSRPVTTNLPAAFGMRPLAPVWKIGYDRQRSDAEGRCYDDRARVYPPAPGGNMQGDPPSISEGLDPHVSVKNDSLDPVSQSPLSAHLNSSASTLQSKTAGGAGLLAQADTKMVVPGAPTILPPVLIPGTRANNDIVNSIIDGFQSLKDAAGIIFNAKPPQNPKPTTNPPQPSPPIFGWLVKFSCGERCDLRSAGAIST